MKKRFRDRIPFTDTSHIHIRTKGKYTINLPIRVLVHEGRPFRHLGWVIKVGCRCTLEFNLASYSWLSKWKCQKDKSGKPREGSLASVNMSQIQLFHGGFETIPTAL
jgi:hypothetical protein